jgi:hypothetical protein
MSVQALSWAIEQQLPAKPKLALIALANHAEPGTGYCHFETATIAREASTSPAGLWRYLGALERNGYLSKTIRKTKRGDERDYWLAFSRNELEAWAWGTDASDPEPAEAGEPEDEDLRTEAYRQFLSKNNAA